MADEQLLPDEEENEARAKMHPEVRVISGMIRSLDKLTPSSRARVVAYLASLYGEKEA